MVEGDTPTQWDNPINSENISHAIEFLLSLDQSAIHEAHRSYAYRWINTLKEAFEQHHYRSQKDYWVLFTETTRPLLMEHSLQKLLLYANRLATILTSEAQSSLRAYLAHPEMGLPQIAIDMEEDDENF